ncbi:MAG: 2-amino-4-hydroxy-6-hydroxymethyldihydropteridine diphosphokinase [Gemmatimonadales bacterium]|nr:2-amino-4-hydroxy-6-hydroxymethyldihydropteridine diphosphokinase [Gemmatimonadales bacterium]
MVSFIGLGGNQGDRAGHLQAALLALTEHPAVRVINVSRVYETEFLGEGQQDAYLNACAEVCTTLPPLAFLGFLQGIEIAEGRRPNTHLQPRPLDLDILLFGGFVQRDPGLFLPHPRMRERAFVLVPLAEIAGSEIFPDSRETVTEACAKIRRKDGSGVALRPEIEIWAGP